MRVESMFSATFTTDAAGQPVQPANFLLAGTTDLSKQPDSSTAVWVRNDESGKWTLSQVAPHRGGVRSLATHVDRKTGVHHIFAGTWDGGIHRGAYAPNKAQVLVWDAAPELSGTGRVMCFAECNGELYAACGLKNETEQSGGLFRRIDGVQPRWEQVYRWPYLAAEHGDETKIMRGLTAVPDPQGGGHEVLIGTRAHPGIVERIDPGKNHAVTVELDIKAFVAKAKSVKKYKGGCLSAYNRLVPFTTGTGEKVHLIGLCLPQAEALQPPDNGAFFLVRRLDGTYELGSVYDPRNPVPAGQSLRAVRTICVSPFPEDRERTLFFGGYDAYGNRHYNTAWIYKAVSPEPQPPQKKDKPAPEQ